MKKVIFIFLILISCLCLAVVSCADKEESSTDTTTTASIVDGSAEGYIKIGNMQMVWGHDAVPSVAKEFPKSFISKPTAYFDCGGGFWTSSEITNTNDNCIPFYGFFVVGKWQ